MLPGMIKPPFAVGNRLIAALDVPDRAAADTFVLRLGGVPSWIKIGLELSSSCSAPRALRSCAITLAPGTR